MLIAIDSSLSLAVMVILPLYVPSGFKWLASLLGFKGDRKLGKEYILRASSVPNLTQTDALYMLYYIAAKTEHDYAQALVYMQQLNTRFPNNIVFKCRNAEMLYRNNRVPESRVAFTLFIDQCNALGDECNKRDAFLAYYFLTKGYLEENNIGMAKLYYGPAVINDQHEHKKATADLEKWKEQLGGTSKN